MFLRADTIQAINFGPFLDSTDFVTAETALTIAQADRQLSKDGAAHAQSSTTGNATHDTDGWYTVNLSATDTNTEGILKLQVVVAGALPVWETFYVVNANVYDSLFAVAGTDTLDVQVAGVDAGAITAAAVATDAIDADALATDAREEIADQVWDEIITGATHNIATSAGRRLRALQDFGLYEGGAVWIDTVNGVAGTTDFENGTVTNPVDTIADAKTIADSVGLKAFKIIAGSNITLAATFDSYSFFSDDGWTMALGGQSVNNTSIYGATVSGIFSGTPHMVNCAVGAITGPAARIGRSGFTGTVTANNAGDWVIHHCWSEVAGAGGTPVFDFGAAVLNTNLNIRGYEGGWEIQNMGGAGTDTASFDGRGQLVINANCTGGSYRRSGSWRLTDNAGGAVTETLDDNTSNIAAIVADTNELQTDDVPGLIAALNDLSAAQVNAEMVDVITVDTIAELAQGQPTATPTVATALMLLYMALRNKLDVDASEKQIHNAAGTVIAKKALSDDATTYSEATMVTGP